MSVSGVTSSSQIQTDYMKLLVTQLQNQNPLEPMDNNQMASQLTSFSELQQLESMNSNFASVLKNTQLNYAVSLMDKQIAFTQQNEAGETETASGVVKQVYNDTTNDKIILVTGDNKTVDMDSIISVMN